MIYKKKSKICETQVQNSEFTQAHLLIRRPERVGISVHDVVAVLNITLQFLCMHLS
jgi:hypothetical protein